VVTFEGDDVPLGKYRREWVSRQDEFANAFEIPQAPGHLFERVGRERLPIREVFGPTDLPEQVQTDIRKLAEQTARRVFQERMEDELDRMFAIGAATRNYAGEPPG
jgi:hypothetical protein